MNNNRNVMYPVAAVAGGLLAVWAGLPAYYLLLLACPVMMLVMMSAMSGGMGRSNDNASSHREATKSETKHSAP